jgi:hypothetical protein
MRVNGRGKSGAGSRQSHMIFQVSALIRGSILSMRIELASHAGCAGQAKPENRKRAKPEAGKTGGGQNRRRAKPEAGKTGSGQNRRRAKPEAGKTGGGKVFSPSQREKARCGKARIHPPSSGLEEITSGPATLLGAYPKGVDSFNASKEAPPCVAGLPPAGPSETQALYPGQVEVAGEKATLADWRGRI